MEHNLFNGRVDILSKDAPSYGYGNCQGNNSSDGFDIVSKSISHTPVSSVFFSKLNINALHEGICNTVFNKTGINIQKQNDIELKIIMRSIYFQSLKEGTNVMKLRLPFTNSKTDTIDQVRELNQKVINWASNEIEKNMKQFECYQRDISSYPMPMDRSIYTDNSGTKSNEYKSFF
jgi:hypothetical protein